MQICSDCFVKTWQRRLQAPTLFNQEHKDYLISNYKEIQALRKVDVSASTFSESITKGPIIA
jgi:hypothetical protein